MNAAVSDFLLVLCTCPDDGSAAALATALLEQQLAACVNRVPGMKSLYRWEGHVEKDDEILLLIKTRAALFGELEAAIRRLHPYEVPEIIGLPLAAGNTEYLDWIRSSTL